MSYYPEPDNHVRNKVKLVFDLSNYATKKLEHATGVNISDLAAKNMVLLWKFKLININKLFNVPTSLHDLKTKVNDLYIDKFKTVHVDVKKLSNVVGN